MVRDKCGADKIGSGTAKEVPELKSEKELAVYEAFVALGMVLEKKWGSYCCPLFCF